MRARTGAPNGRSPSSRPSCWRPWPFLPPTPASPRPSGVPNPPSTWPSHPPRGTWPRRAELQGLATKNFDASTFNAWFTAYVSGNQSDIQVAENRFRPQFDVAFKAWLATDPFSNPDAPKGPTYMPEYVQPEQAQTTALDHEADDLYAEGQSAAENSDSYIRTTVLLASVLFLVGISGHFRVRAARTGLIVVGAGILITSVVLIATTPRPPF